MIAPADSRLLRETCLIGGRWIGGRALPSARACSLIDRREPRRLWAALWLMGRKKLAAREKQANDRPCRPSPA